MTLLEDMALVIERKALERSDNRMVMMDASFIGPRPNSRDFHAVEETLRDCFIHAEKLKVLLEDADAQIQRASVNYTKIRLEYLQASGSCLSSSQSP